MSVLLELKKQIDGLIREEAILERALVDHPGYPSIAANLESAVRMRMHLENEFRQAASHIGIETFSYRSFDEHDRTNAQAAFSAISDFLTFVSVVYAALKEGKKSQVRIPGHIAREIGFDLGYTFSGSIGVVLTTPRDNDLFDRSVIDTAMRTVFAMAQTNSPQQLEDFVEEIGPAAVTALFRWANDNARNGLGAEVKWGLGRVAPESLFVQRQQLSELTTMIEVTNTDVIDEFDEYGTLDSASVSGRRFKLTRG